MKRTSMVFLLALLFAGEIISALAETNIKVLQPLPNSPDTRAFLTNAFTLTLDAEIKKALLDATQDKWFKPDAFVSTLLGGALAIAGGLAASWYAHTLTTKNKRAEDKEFANNVLRAVRRELESLQAIFQGGMGPKLEEVKDGQILWVRLALTQDWFTVFSANAAHLGRLDAEAAKRIVTAYALLKSLIEEFRINNQYLAELDEISLRVNLANRNVGLDKDHQQKLRLLTEQATRIKGMHAKLRAEVGELFTLLDQCEIR